MKSDLKFHIILSVLVGTVFTMGTAGQPTRYEHPFYDIGFEATPDWHQELPDNNSQALMVTHPNNNMRIQLSFVPDCRNPRRYLKRMSGNWGLVSQRGTYDTLLNDRRAVVVYGMCLEEKRPSRRMAVGLPHRDGLYLVEICCPEECYRNHQEQIKSILESIRVGSQ